MRRRPSHDLVLAGRGAEIVSVILPAGAELWAEHVVAFAAERLVRSMIKVLPQDEPRTASSLVLPSGMVVGRLRPSASCSGR